MRFIVCFILGLVFFLPTSLSGAVELQPHRAYYTVTMEGRPLPQNSVVEIQGTMLIELNKVPGGWTVQELSDIKLIHNDGSTEVTRWGYVTFENDEGSFLQFNTYRKTDGELVENIQGHAKREGKKVKVTYRKPTKKTAFLADEVLFPTQHVKALLETAQKGESIFPRIVFDGSSETGASEINTFIGAKKAGTEGKSMPQFANQPFWPIRFAVHSEGKADYQPLYVTTQDLLPNGIIKQYVIDYGGIKIRGVLDRLELLTENGS